MAAGVGGDHLAPRSDEGVDHSGPHPAELGVGHEAVVQHHRRPPRGITPAAVGDAGAVGCGEGLHGPIPAPVASPDVTTPLFALEGVGLERDGTTILRDVDLTVSDAGITVLVGASGAGKSTLLRCLNRLECPTSGTISFRGRPLADLDPLAHRRRVAMVFQAPTPFPGTVADNLRAVVADLTDDDACRLLHRVGLPRDLLDRSADALSGGEAQRLVLARALTTAPEVLLADEATSALDATATRHLEELARAMADDGMPVLWVTHDLAQARRLADHLVVTRAGLVTWTGPAADPAAEPAVRDALREEAA